MNRERWGTFSVSDHKRKRAFVADILLYDRLIIPYPANDNERAYWWKKTWMPGRLDSYLDILGDHAIQVPWDDEKRERFNSRYQVGKAAGFDANQLSSAREQKVDPFYITRLLLTQDFLPELPQNVSKVWAMPAYPSFYEFKKDIHLDIEEEQERKQNLLCAIANRFLVPADANMSNEQLLRKAVQLADEDDFKGHRSEFYSWQEDIIEKDIPIENAIKEMEQHLEKLNGIVKKAETKVRWKFAFTIIPIGLALGGVAFATSPLALPLAGAGALISLVKFAKFDRKPEYQAGHHAPAMMFHDSRKIFV